MDFIQVGQQYINMSQVHHAEQDDRFPEIVLYLYTSDHTIRITDPDERNAVLGWLRRNSTRPGRNDR